MDDEETEKIIDFITKQVRHVALKDVPHGYICVSIDDQIYWAAREQIQQSEIRHPPFDGEQQQRIERIVEYFREVYPKDYLEWEDGFRRDSHPGPEIDLWFHIAMSYRRFSEYLKEHREKKELFNLLVECSMSAHENIVNTFSDDLLSREFIRQVAQEYFERNLAARSSERS